MNSCLMLSGQCSLLKIRLIYFFPGDFFKLFQVSNCVHIVNTFRNKGWMFKFVNTLFDKNWKSFIMSSICLSSYQLDSNYVYTSFVITIFFNVSTMNEIYDLHIKILSSSFNGEALTLLRTGSVILKKTPSTFSTIINTFDK